jgi:hypothetical protein
VERAVRLAIRGDHATPASRFRLAVDGYFRSYFLNATL